MTREERERREETKAVKKALAAAGILARVTHGTGTAWGWLYINIDKLRNENTTLNNNTILAITQETTGRSGDWNGSISVYYYNL